MSGIEGKTVRLDGVDYDLDAASPEARSFVVKLRELDMLYQERNNFLVVLNKAKNAYIAELKTEIIKNKTGVDLSSLFDEE